MLQAPSGRWRIAVVLVRHGLPSGRGELVAYLQGLLRATGGRGLQARLAALRWRAGDFFAPAEASLPAIMRDLEELLWDQGDLRCFHTTLHDREMMRSVATALAEWRADELVLLPPDPFFSPLRNGWAMAAWRDALTAAGLEQRPSRQICCHPTDPLLLQDLLARARHLLEEAALQGRPDLLLMLPWGIGDAGGDPSAWQAGRLGRELQMLLGLQPGQVHLCQSPLPGLRTPPGPPPVDGMLRQLAREGRPLVLLPLMPVPLGLPDRLQASGIRHFHIAPPAGLAAETARLAHLLRQSRAGHEGVCAGFGARQCPGDKALCPYRKPAAAAMPAASPQVAAMRVRA